MQNKKQEKRETGDANDGVDMKNLIIICSPSSDGLTEECGKAGRGKAGHCRVLKMGKAKP